MTGWRGAIGFISPSTFHLPWGMQELVPEGVRIIAANLGVRTHQAAEFERARQGTEAAIDLVVGEGARAVVLMGVPVAVRQGYAGDAASNQALSERAGVPVTSGVAAVVDAMRHLGLRRPAVVTAYLDTINAEIAAYFTEAGLPPAGVQGLSVLSPAEAARVEPTTYYALARTVVAAHPDADAIFFGTREFSPAVGTALERDLGLPVLHGQQAGLWWALRHLRIAPDRDWGRLLRPDSGG